MLNLAEVKGAGLVGLVEREQKGDNLHVFFPVCLGSNSAALVSQSL